MNRQALRTVAEHIFRLRDSHRLSAAEYKAILRDDTPETLELLRAQAREAADEVFGRGIFVRGLLEISNHCRNNCLYCGLRSSDTALVRYRLTKQEILSCCSAGHLLGLRTFVLQGGEDPAQTDAWVENVTAEIHASFPDCAITLSLGEKSPQGYRRFRRAGADRYLLRHETADPAHYNILHPAPMSQRKRLECLRTLKREGYQTGTGFMVGSPRQTLDNIVEDLLFIQDFRPEMIGIGPFIHHSATPFAHESDGSVPLTLKLLSILRLMDPQALIPSTTALSTLCPHARTEGLLAGANVVMPNISPAGVRDLYSIYPGKASSGAEAVEGLEELKKELAAAGFHIAEGRGDYKKAS